MKITVIGAGNMGSAFVKQLTRAGHDVSVTARDGLILPAHLPPDISRAISTSRNNPLHVDVGRPLPEQLSELTATFEERYLRKALKRTHGHVGKCAKLSGLSRRSITDKIAHYKINKTEFKQD